MPQYFQSHEQNGYRAKVTIEWSWPDNVTLVEPREMNAEFVAGEAGEDEMNAPDTAAETLAHYERVRAEERERCAKIVEARAKLWNDAVAAGAHEDCSMSLAEECEDIASAIRGTLR